MVSKGAILVQVQQSDARYGFVSARAQKDIFLPQLENKRVVLSLLEFSGICLFWEWLVSKNEMQS